MCGCLRVLLLLLHLLVIVEHMAPYVVPAVAYKRIKRICLQLPCVMLKILCLNSLHALPSACAGLLTCLISFAAAADPWSAYHVPVAAPLQHRAPARGNHWWRTPHLMMQQQPYHLLANPILALQPSFWRGTAQHDAVMLCQRLQSCRPSILGWRCQLQYASSSRQRSSFSAVVLESGGKARRCFVQDRICAT